MVLSTIGRRMRPLTRWCRREPTIAEILSDPIIAALMNADGVDPDALEAQLRSTALEVSVASQAGRTRTIRGTWSRSLPFL